MPDIYGNIPNSNNRNEIPSFTETPQVDDNLTPVGADNYSQPVDKADTAWSAMFQFADRNTPTWAKSQQFTSPALRTPYKETERYLDPNIGYNALDPDLEVKYGEAHPIAGIVNRLIKTGAGVGASILQAGNDIASVFSGNAGVDNSFDTTINDWTKRLDQVTLPTYQTEYQKEHPILSYFNPFHLESWLQNVGNAAQQLAPIAGTIASSLVVDSALGLATDGIADGLLAPRQLRRVMTGMDDFAKGLTAEGKDFETFNKLLSTNSNVSEAVNNALNATRNFKYGANATRYMLANGVSSYLMSQMIGNQTYNEVKNDILNQYKDEYGNVQLTDEMRSKIEQNAKDAGNAVLLPNFAFMSISSAFGLSSILRPSEAAIEATEKALSKEATVVLSDKNPNVFTVKPKPVTKGLSGFLQKSFRKDGWLVDNLRQSLTMGGFYVSGDATKNFYENKFNIPGTVDTMSLAGSYLHSLGKLFTTTEGEESLALGFLGGAMEHVGKLFAKPNSTEFSDSIGKTLNAHTVTGLFDVSRQEAISSSTIAHDMQEAAATGDVFRYKNLQHEALFNFVSSAEKVHQFDARVNQLNALKTLDKENFQTLFNLDFTEENKRTVNSYIDALVDKAKSIRQDVSNVERSFPPNPFSPKEEAMDYASYNFYKDELAFNIGKQKDYLRRSIGIKEDTLNKIPSASFEDIIRMSSDEGIDKTIQKFEDKIKTLRESESLSGDNKELKKPFTDEREFLEKSVEDLKSHKQQKDPDSFIKTLGSIYDYYGNLNTPSGDFHIDEPSVLRIYNNGVDANKLLNAGRAVAEYYRKLASKSGFETFKGDLYSALGNYKDKLAVDSTGLFRLKTDQELSTEQAPSVDIYKEAPTKEEALSKIDAEDKEFIAKVIDPYADPNDPTELANKIISGETPISKDIKDQAKALIEEDFNRTSVDSTDSSVVNQMKDLGVMPSTTIPDASDPMEQVYADQDLKIANDEVSTNILDKVWKGISPVKLLNKMFTPKNAKDAPFDENLRNILFNSNTKTPNFKNLRVEVSDNIDYKGKKPSRIIGSEMYRREYDKHAYVYDGDKPIGILQPPSSIVFKRGDSYLPITQFADAAEYAEATKNNPNTFDTFKLKAQKYERAYNELIKDHKEGDPVLQVSPNKFASIFDTELSYGSRDGSDNEKDSTLIKDLKYKGKGSAILSFPTVLVEDGTWQKLTKPNILNEDKLTDEELFDVLSFVDNNIKTFDSTDRRYFYLNKMPDGKFHPVSIIAARVANESEEGLSSAFDIIKTAISNPESIQSANESLRNQLYISDRNVSRGNGRKVEGNQIRLGVTKDGDLSVSVFNTRLKLPEHTTIISKADVENTNNFDDLSNLIETKFNESKKADYNLGERLRPVISKTSFKKNALNDNEITSEQAEAGLKASVKPNVFKGYALEFMPKDTTDIYTPAPAEVTTVPEAVTTPEVSSIVEVPSLQNTDNSVVNDYKTKKADIERRRQEELNNNKEQIYSQENKPSNGIVLSDKNGTILKEGDKSNFALFNIKGNEADVAYIGKARNENWFERVAAIDNPLSDNLNTYSKIITIESGKAVKENGEWKVTKPAKILFTNDYNYSKSNTDLEKINAKYDAELSALAEKPKENNSVVENKENQPDISKREKIINDNLDSVISQLEQKGIAKKEC